MKSAARFLSSFVGALSAVLVISASASAQDLPPAPAAPLPTVDAQQFIGDWSLPITGDQPAEFLISISDNAGNLDGTVTIVGMTEASRVSNFTKSADDLLLAYMLDLGGQSAPVTIRLTPVSAESLNAVLDFADGMFTATGTATKR